MLPTLPLHLLPPSLRDGIVTIAGVQRVLPVSFELERGEVRRERMRSVEECCRRRNVAVWDTSLHRLWPTANPESGHPPALRRIII
jgi:hypothetical protein